MCSALGGVLTIDKRIVLLTIHLAVGESTFKIAIAQMDNGINDRGVDVTVKQIKQPILCMKQLTIEDDGKAVVEKHIIPQHFLHILGNVMVLAENIFIRHEGNDGS